MTHGADPAFPQIVIARGARFRPRLAYPSRMLFRTALLLVVQGHDVPIDDSKVRFGLDWFGMAAHGDCHTHVDALCHLSYEGLTYNGRRATEVLRTNGAIAQDIAAYHTGSSAAVCCSTARGSAASNGSSRARWSFGSCPVIALECMGRVRRHRSSILCNLRRQQTGLLKRW